MELRLKIILFCLIILIPISGISGYTKKCTIEEYFKAIEECESKGGLAFKSDKNELPFCIEYGTQEEKNYRIKYNEIIKDCKKRKKDVIYSNRYNALPRCSGSGERRD